MYTAELIALLLVLNQINNVRPLSKYLKVLSYGNNGGRKEGQEGGIGTAEDSREYDACWEEIGITKYPPYKQTFMRGKHTSGKSDFCDVKESIEHVMSLTDKGPFLQNTFKPSR